jgi:hypothetical protein
MQAATRPSGRSASGAARLSIDAIAWLRSDVVDVVAVLPGNPAHAGLGATEDDGGSPADLAEGLARWSRRFTRERLFVLAPRGLSLALSLSALIALVFAVSGSMLNLAVALCLSVPPLVALAVVLASSWREPSQREVARVFDRDLALDERLGTAVEISGAGLAVDGLAALVLAEANAALATSHRSGVRPTHRSARREWLVSAVALLTISFLLFLIAGRGESPGLGRLAAGTSAGHPAGPTSVANTGGAKHARRLITARSRNSGPDERRETAPSSQSAGRNSALSVVTQPQSATAGGRLPAGGGNQRTRPGVVGRSGSQTADLGAKAHTRGASGGTGTRAGSGSTAQASTHAAGSAHSGRAASTRRAAGGGHTTNPKRVGAGSRTGRFDSNRATSSRGSAKGGGSGNSQAHGAGKTRSPSGQSAVHTQRSPGGQGHSVGNSAGAGSGGSPFGRPQTTGLPSGSARLPIQAGYTPVRTKSGTKSSGSARGSGGNGRARSSTESGFGSATAVTLPYIPPSADIGHVDNALLRNYFSSAPTASKRW